jgi:hypothetical protein
MSGIAAQRPLQHESPIAQISPSARHAGNSWQTIMPPPSPGAAQVRPQQSSFLAHGSPAGRQSGTGAQAPAMQVPAQQSCATVHGAPIVAHAGPPHSPPEHDSAQQAPAVAQVCPSDEQPAGLAQTRWPVPAGSGAQMNEQQSAPIAHAAPSGWQTGRAQRASVHDPEQQSPPFAQPAPFARQSTIGNARGMVSSTSRRQPADGASAASATAATTANDPFKARRRRRACARRARSVRADIP